VLNENLVFAKNFLEHNNLLDHLNELRNNWSSEIAVLYTSRVTNKLLTGDFYLDTRFVKSSIIRELSAEERMYIYEVLRLACSLLPGLKILMDDYDSLLHSRGFLNKERYLYLSSLSENSFNYEMDTILGPWNPKARRRYYRLKSSYFGRRHLSLLEVFKEYFFQLPVLKKKPLAKKKVRHKGYRDHGSLGSEYSQVHKEERDDVWVQEKYRQKEKDRQDLIDFLQGLNDTYSFGPKW
jgi:hypothetical protein